MLAKTLTKTDLQRNDKFHRLINKIESRLAYFKKEIDYRISSPYHAEYTEILEDFTFKSKNYINRLKSVVYYFNYNKTVGKERRQQLVEYINKRDNSYETAYEWVKEWPNRKDHLEELFSIKIPDFDDLPQSDVSILLKNMAESAYLNSVQCIKTRMELSIREALEKNWYMTFTTLTLKPEEEETVFAPGSRIWRDYIRNFRRKLGIQLYGSVREAAKHHYMDFVGVVERGEKGMLHLHIFMLMKKPLDCADPNFGLMKPYKREIDEYCHLWEYGHSQTIAVRWGANDVWAKDGWVWPIDPDTGLPILTSSVPKLCNYITNYILESKLAQMDKKEIITWRTRCSRMMGTRKIRGILAKMPIQELVTLTKINRPYRPIVLYDKPIPYRLIRELAVKEALKRYRKLKMNQEALPTDTRMKTLLQNGIKTKLNHKSRNFGEQLAQLLKGRDISNISHYYYERAAQFIEKYHIDELAAVPVAGGKTPSLK